MSLLNPGLPGVNHFDQLTCRNTIEKYCSHCLFTFLLNIPIRWFLGYRTHPILLTPIQVAQVLPQSRKPERKQLAVQGTNEREAERRHRGPQVERLEHAPGDCVMYPSSNTGYVPSGE